MSETELEMDLDELSSAEDFLDYFGIEYEPSIVHVNRLHILQRFHDYMAGLQEIPEDEDRRRGLYAEWLARAYHDFVESDALTEKVFKVFKANQLVQVEVPLADITRQERVGATEV